METVVTGQANTALVPNAMDFSGVQVFKDVDTAKKGTIIDTSESGEEASSLPEALERL